MLAGDKPSAVYKKHIRSTSPSSARNVICPLGVLDRARQRRRNLRQLPARTNRVPLEPERRCPESSRSLPFVAQGGTLAAARRNAGGRPKRHSGSPRALCPFAWNAIAGALLLLFTGAAAVVRPRVRAS
jgi:hypothetical protein